MSFKLLNKSYLPWFLEVQAWLDPELKLRQADPISYQAFHYIECGIKPVLYISMQNSKGKL